jgi:hypothetical protein
MKSPVFDFKSINRKLSRLEQKAEYDSKNAVACGSASRLTGGSCESVTLTIAQLPLCNPDGLSAPEFIPVDRWVIEEIERVTGISNVKI